MSKTIRIDIKYTSMNDEGHSVGLPNSFRVLNQLQDQLDRGSTDTILITPEVDLEVLASDIHKAYKRYDDKRMIQASEGVLQGCYGSNTGMYDAGLTLWVDSSLFPDRFLDESYDEIVNIEVLMNEHGTLLEADADSVHAAFEALGIEGVRDNTYNYLGDYDEPTPLCQVDFTLYQAEGGDLGGPCVVVAKFHYGGDVRGNYTDEYVYKFTSLEDAYSALRPPLHCIDESLISSDEFRALKEDLWKLKGKALEKRKLKIESLLKQGR